jgi:hypothetical protein
VAEQEIREAGTCIAAAAALPRLARAHIHTRMHAYMQWPVGHLSMPMATRTHLCTARHLLRMEGARRLRARTREKKKEKARARLTS